MRISTRGRYGLRAMVDLAVHADKGPVALREIARRQNVSESYLEQVFSVLRKNGLVTALRGAQGGYELARPAAEISAGEILRALEGPLSPVHCVDAARRGKACERENDCAMRDFWRELRDHINGFLDAASLEDLAERAAAGKDGILMYYI